MASIYHRTVFADGLIPMVRNCLASDAHDDVFAPAAAAVVELLQSARVWERVLESHFSYDASTEQLRNKFAHNGYLTQARAIQHSVWCFFLFCLRVSCSRHFLT